MPYIFAPPLETKREKNPAQELLEWGGGDSAKPLGQTYLRCDGVGVENLIPTLPRHTIAQEGKIYKIDEIQPVTHNFTSTIVVPPAPINDEYWRSSITSWTFLNNLASRLPHKGIFRQQISYLTGTVRLIPKPTAHEFYQHVINHEKQHVADNLWAVNSVFYPWHVWLEKVYKSYSTFTFKEKSNIEWFLGGGVQPVAYGKYLYDLCNELGMDFHNKTDEGAAPIYTVTGVCDGSGFNDGDLALKIEVSAKALIRAMEWNSRPHRDFNLHSIASHSAGGATQAIDGPPIGMIPLTTLKAPDVTQSDINKREVTEEDDGQMIGFFD